MKNLITEIRAFYPEYLEAHSDRTNKVLHFIGATLFFAFLFLAAFTLTWWYLPVAVFFGYIFPGIGHHYFERNKSFRASKPVLCVACAFRLYLRMLTFGII